VLYKEEVGDKFFNHVDGITKDDLEQYTVAKIAPVQGEFNGYHVYSASPTMSGITVIQSLDMAKLYQKLCRTEKFTETQYIHLVSEVSKQDYKDRQDKIGDPNFTDMNMEELVSEDHIEQLAEGINIDEITTDFEVNDSPADEKDYDNTTHFVIIDQDGMVVST